ncbi:MAG: preprotein translocase subunit SecE [Alistipes senegalensis]|nr:preprotein translocase subunit SecE [Oxalobacter formigenes]MCM1280303.1 preprotein translocase subunit SecE [Alistipes senegalensis]
MNDKIKIIIALAACVAGIVGYYLLATRPVFMRAGVLVFGLAVGAVIAWFSETGRDFLVFARESVRETRKVVWPERKDALRVTAIVFGFAIVMALFLFGTDKVLEVVLYDFILGWNRQ